MRKHDKHTLILSQYLDHKYLHQRKFHIYPLTLLPVSAVVSYGPWDPILGLGISKSTNAIRTLEERDTRKQGRIFHYRASALKLVIKLSLQLLPIDCSFLTKHYQALPLPILTIFKLKSLYFYITAWEFKAFIFFHWSPSLWLSMIKTQVCPIFLLHPHPATGPLRTHRRVHARSHCLIATAFKIRSN